MQDTRTMMAEAKFYESYSRFDDALGRYETWDEAIDRVMSMHRQYYAGKMTDELDTYIEFATNAYKDKLAIGSQRALQYGGEQLLKHQMRLYNCLASYADRPEFFGEFFYTLLCGCGVGFSVQYHHIQKLPKIAIRTKQPKQHLVEDSIEGWATALDVLMSSYFQGGGKHPEYEGRKVYFDLSAIRPKGAKISGGFKAPGPDPLRLALDRIEYILQGRVLKEKEAVLKPIEVYDICMHASDAVLAGGVRRSATICVFSPEDHDMMTSKTGNWFDENPQRARSNNSALILRDKVTKSDFHVMMQNIKQFGEPGFIFADSLDFMSNPCVEIGFTPYLLVGDQKISGFQACNLSEINGAKCNDVQTFYDGCVAAAILGTLQAGYTDFKFVTETTKKIIEKEALLGVSITGWMNNPEILFDESVLKEGARIVKKTNETIAKLIGINPAARTTCTKPSGSASIVLETASGIHPEHSPMYLRHIQMNKDTEIAKLIKEKNPYMIEDSVWSANKTDYVVAFPIVASENSLFRQTVYGTKHLDLIKKAQMAWVEEGTNIDLCVDKTTRHNISNTITVDDWDQIEDYIYENRRYFTGIALMSDAGDKSFFQAPNTEVLNAKQIVKKYGTGAMFASGLIVDCMKAYRSPYDAISDYQFGKPLSDDSTDLGKKDWRRRFEKYAKNYFKSDIQKAEHCLKDVYNLHKWEKIQQNFAPVDFKELKEKKFTDIDTMGAMACAGVSENGEVGCII